MFKKNMKKALALLASLLILCSLIPMSALLTANAAGENVVANGGFEDGKDKWTFNSGTSEIVEDAHGGNKALSLTNPGLWSEGAIQTIPVDANSEYTITWYSKRVSGAGVFNLYVMNANGYANLESISGENWMNKSASAGWVKNEYVVKSGSATSIILKFSTEASNPGTILLDDISVVKVGGGNSDTPDEPDNGNLLKNGNFDNGELAPWDNLWGNNEVSFVDGREGGKAIKVISGQWTHVRQKVTVEKNTDYVITGWHKNTNNIALLVKDGNDTKNIKQETMNSGSTWTKITLEFNSGNYDSVYVSIMGNEGGGQGTYDDFVMTKVGGDQPDTPDEPDEPTDSLLVNGDFETGEIAPWDNLWGSNEVSFVDGRNGGKAMKVISGQWTHVRQKVSVEKNTDYVITGWHKNTNNIALLVKDGNDSTNIKQDTMNSGDTWTKITLEFNSGNYDSVYVSIMGNEGGGQGIYDDFSMVKKGSEPDQPDTPDEPTSGLQNGNFETGDLTGWSAWQDTEVSKDAKKNGQYGVTLKGDGGWGGLLDQTFTVTKGKEYTLSFWYKAKTGGANFVVKENGGSIASYWGNAREWTQFTLEFTASSTELLLNICGGGDNVAAEVYVDDFVLAEKSGDEPDQPDNPDNPDEPAAGFQNGDFETGDLTGWQPWQNTEVSKDAKKSGEYGAHLKGDGGWGGLLDQTFAVTKGQDYILTFWYKANAAGANFVLKSGSNSIISAWCNTTDWTKVELEFTAPSEEILLNICGGGTGVAEDIYVDDFVLSEKSPFSTELINGDFENGDEGWTLGTSASIVDNDTHNGTGALKLDNPNAWGEAAMQTVAVEKNTNYVITWYAKRLDGSKAFNLILMDGNNQNIKDISGATWMNETSGDWVKYEITVPTADASELRFKWTTEASNPGIILIDDITMVKEGEEPEPTDGNLIKNGSFEKGKDDWNWKEPTELSKDAFVGEASAKLDFNAAYGEALTQTVKIKPNTDYVMIWYTRRVSGSGAWDLFLMDYDTINVTNMNVECDGQKWFNQTDKEWTESRISFNSGETTKLYVKFGPEADNAGVFLLDEVGLYVKGTEPEGPIEPPTPPKTSMYLTSYGVVNNRPITADKNMLDNGSFEKANGGQWQEGFTGDTISIVKDDTTRFGDKSLYFNTAGINTETKVVFWMDVEPDTSYVFSTWLKGKYMSDDNRARATIGVVGEDLAYLEMDEYKMLDGSIQIVPTAWDNEWHLRSVEFNTGSATKVGIAMSGTNSQMYIDDMALFAVGHGCKYMSDNMKGSVTLSYSIDHYACEDEDSLIPDPNFNTKDESGFWADSYGWRNNVLSFVDNEYEYGTSMKYTASDRKAALSTIKWVELEKETQYVFAVDLKILKDGFGKLVLFDDKLKDKINFLEISFDSYDYDPEVSLDGWYTIVCSFNTEVYERIGIAIVDDGGEVLLDNMRLFKKSDGAEVEDDYIAPPTTTTTTEATTEYTDATTEWTDATTQWTDATTEWTDATTEWTDATTEWTDATTEWTEVPTYTYPTYTYPIYTYPIYTYPTYTYPEYTDATTEWTDATTEWTDATTEWTEYYPEYTYPYYPEYTYPEYTDPYYPEYTYPMYTDTLYPEYTDPFYTDITEAITWPEFTEPSYYATDAPTEPSQAVEGSESDTFSTVMLWVGIGTGSAAVLAGGGFLVIMLIKKRKKPEGEIEIPEE